MDKWNGVKQTGQCLVKCAHVGHFLDVEETRISRRLQQLVTFWGDEKVDALIFTQACHVHQLILFANHGSIQEHTFQTINCF